MLKKALYAVNNMISVLIIAAAMTALLAVLFTPQGQVPRVLGYTMLRITTGSMEPTYPVDTLIIVKKTDASAIRRGDVISFYSEDPELDGAVNTHRVSGIEELDGSLRFYTKGDHNQAEDPYSVRADRLVGKVVASSLVMGKISRLVANPLIFIPAIILPLAVILISSLVRTVKLAGQLAREEEEAQVQETLQLLRTRKAEKERTAQDADKKC